MPVSNTKKKAPKLDIRNLNLGNVQPQALEMETSIIGSILLNRDALSEAASTLKPEYFYDPRNEKIFEAIIHLFGNKQPVDAITVVERLKQEGNFEAAGGLDYITDVTTQAHSASHVEYYSKIVMQKYIARELIRVSIETQSKAFDDQTDVDDLLKETQGQIFEISNRNVKRDVRQINPYIEEALHRIMEASKRKEGISGIPSGYAEVDKVTFGWQDSDLIIIAARPAMGKTAFVLSMIKNIAIDGVMTSKGHEQIPCAMFSLEMSCVQLVNRLLVSTARIPGNTVRSAQLTREEWGKIDFAIKAMQDAPIYIDDTPQLSILELRTKVMRLVSEHGIRIVFIDYLQLMNAQGMNFFSREGEVSLISRSLKGLAKELNIPIVALSQLNRNSEKREGATTIEGRKPQLSDLRESGAIEQDADIVAFIHRPEYYKIFEDNGKDLRGVAQFLIAKHRNGSTEDIDLRFYKDFALFTSLNTEIEQSNASYHGLLSSRTNDARAANNALPDPDTNFSADYDAQLPPPSSFGGAPF